MSRPKGSKNKIKVPEEKGNPDFNLNDAEPINEPIWEDAKMEIKTEPKIATGAVTEEDLALDRELDRLANEMPIPDIDPEPAGAGLATKEKAVNHLLSEVVDDYRPASTINELIDQVHMAKQYGCDSIECTLPVGRRYVKDGSLETVGYFSFHDIKVYLAGKYEMAQARDKRSVWEIENRKA